MSSTSRSATASPALPVCSESTVTAGGNDGKVGGDADIQGVVEGGDDTHDPELVELPVGYTPHLPSSSEPPSLQNRPRRLVWVVRSWSPTA